MPLLREETGAKGVPAASTAIMARVGTLYLVSTPIGNLGDISLRALDTLRSASLIVAEDTRHTRKLLTHYDIHGPLLSYNEHSPPARLGQILEALREGDVAAVTDAGTPGVSDPGRELVLAAYEEGLPVSAVPGPSAVLSALILSGLPTESFLFLGFLPRRPRERQEKLRQVRDLGYTLVLFEAPHRLLRTLEALEDELGDRPIAVTRELTKLHEEIRRSTISAERAYWTANQPRGEYTLVIGQGAPQEPEEAATSPLDEVERLVEGGMHASAAVRQVAHETGTSRKQLYQEWLEKHHDSPP
ncbi:MAG: 16S rRNA (cytidine(1402)-2'-O)-methyltransferase [Chloroflexota bacterium]|nr:16S rRNA (cytidine(1402)-2'-O)-methyltransferase [Chloroflexota bacterium]